MPLEWTDEGRAELRERLDAAHAAAPRSARGRRAELERMFEAALADAPQPVGAADVARVGPTVVMQWQQWNQSRRGSAFTFFVVVAVIVLPILVTLVELTSHMCGVQFFDPIPTWTHLALVCWVPISGVLGLVWLGQPAQRMDAVSRGFAIGLALPVTILYGLAFLPLLPLSLVALLMVIGVLGLTPVLCACAYPFLAARLDSHLPFEAGRYQRGFWLGIGACLCAWMLADLRAVLTAHWVQAAVRGDRAERADAIVALRRHGDGDVMARAASGSPGVIGPVGVLVNGGWHQVGTEVTTESVRKVWFLVHGERFQGPLRSSIGLEHFGWRESVSDDPGLGGEQVGAGFPGLELIESRIDGAFDAPAGLAYLEWTMEFSNRGSRGFDAEARVLLDLPDEAVVSRATLWVEGEPREAAFAGTATTRAAYRSVAVRQRKDPLLVTCLGDDRAFVQCAPVPFGGRMRIRVGITVPLEVLESSSSLRLPRIASRNFVLPNSLEHSVAIEARHPIAAGETGGIDRRDDLVRTELATRTEPDGRVVVEGRLPKESLDGGAPAVHVGAPSRAAPVVARATSAGEVLCRFTAPVARTSPPPIVVVDGSAPMERVVPYVGDALRRAFPKESLTIFVVLDAGESERIEAAPGDDLGELLADVDYVGGRESAPVLAQAFDLARQRATDLLWIAGPNPETMPGEELDRRIESNHGATRLACVQAVAGENAILARHVALAAWDGYDAAAGLDRAIYAAVGRNERAFARRWSSAATAPDGAHRGPDHLDDLHAAQEVESLARAGAADRALAIAREHHLVTPVSGAVVLETAAQYDAAGLAPGDAAEMPSVPEPEVVVLVACALAAAAFAWHARRRAARGVAA